MEMIKLMSNNLQSIVLNIYNTNMELQGLILNYTSLSWEEDYYNRGRLMLICVDSPENIALLQQGWYIARKDKKTAMVIRYVKYDSSANEIIIYGYTTNDLIRQRIIERTKKITNVETGIYSAVNENRRGLPIITASPRGYLENFQTQFTGTNLLEACTTLGKESSLGFYTEFDYRNKKQIFTVYKGKNLTYGNTEGNPPKTFSTEFKNLVNAIIIDDMSIFCNVVYVAGAGEGEDRAWIIFGNDIGLNRFELFVDARDLQPEEGQTPAVYEQVLISRGIQKLNEYIRVKTFIGEVDPQGFGSDFYLGDIITCKSDKYGMRLNTRILHYAEVRENGMTKLKLTLGEPEIDFIKVVKTWRN